MIETSSIHQTLAEIVRVAGSKEWVLGGSAGLLLRGISLPSAPRDIDLYCDVEDVHLIHEALHGYATREPELSVTQIYSSTLSQYRIGELRVELVGGFRVTALDSRYSVDVKGILLPCGAAIELQAAAFSPSIVRVVPLAHELWFNALREREDRVRLIAEAMRMEPGTHMHALTAIEACNAFDREVAARVHRRLGILKEGDR